MNSTSPTYPRKFAGFCMGVSGAAVWVFGCLFLPEVIFGQRRLDWQSLLEGLVITAYGTGLTAWLSGGLGAAVGHFLPRHLVGRTAQASFLIGAGAGAAAGLAADTIFAICSMRFDSIATLYAWRRFGEVILHTAVTIVPTCAVWVGLWAVWWNRKLAHQ